MKTKIIQKILAIMISTATITSTPGLASATKPKNGMLGKKTSRPSDLKDDENDDKNIQNIHQENNLDLKSQLPYTEAEKKDFINIINTIKTKDSLKQMSKEEVVKTIHLFKKFIIYNDLQVDIATAIFKMALAEVLKKLSKDEVLQITYLLYICSKNENARRLVASAIFESNKYNLFDKYSEKEICDLIYILQECSKSENAGEYVANAIFKLANQNLLNKYPKEKTLKITNLMIKCIDYGQAAKEAMRSIVELIKHGLLNEYSREEIFKITASINNYSKMNNIGEYGSLVIFELAKKNLLEKFSKKEIIDITNMFINCIRDYGDSIYPESAIVELAKNNLFKKFDKEQVFRLIDILIGPNKLLISPQFFCNCIYFLANHNLLDQIPKTKFLTIIDIINKIPNDADAITKESAAYAIAELMNKNLFMRYYRGDYSEILKFLTQNCNYKSYLLNTTLDNHIAGFAYAFKILAEKDILCNCPKEYMLTIINKLISLSYDIKASPKVAGAFAALADKNLLKSHSKSKILEIVRTLRRCLENNKNVTVDVINTIQNFALNRFPFDQFPNDILYLLNTLEQCDYSKPDARAAAAEAIRALNFAKLLDQLSKHEFQKAINILAKFANIDQAGKIAFAKAIKEFAQANLMRPFNINEIQKIIDNLRSYANEIENNKHINDAINELNILIKWKQHVL